MIPQSQAGCLAWLRLEATKPLSRDGLPVCGEKVEKALECGSASVLLLRGVLPAVFAVAMGALVAAVESRTDLFPALVPTGSVFIALSVLSPIHQALSANLGDRTAAWLYDRLTEASVRPPGTRHLEDPKLTSDLTPIGCASSRRAG